MAKIKLDLSNTDVYVLIRDNYTGDTEFMFNVIQLCSSEPKLMEEVAKKMLQRLIKKGRIKEVQKIVNDIGMSKNK